MTGVQTCALPIYGFAAAFVEHDSDLVGGAADSADDKLLSFVLLHRHPPCVIGWFLI